MSSEKKAQPAPAASDAKLLAAARRGDNAAFGTLMERHGGAATRLARRLAPSSASEVVTTALAAVEAGVRAGTGPRAAFRPYLLTAVRRANYERARAAGKIRPVDELAAGKVLVISESTVTAELLVRTAKAYRELSETQQLALWHTEVDGDPFLETGTLLGISGTEVAELAFGARDALRRAMIGAQLDSATTGPCRWTCDRLGAHVRRRLTPTIAEKVSNHLNHCSTCRELLPAVTAMETEMQPLLAMVVLGSAAGPYLDQDSVPAAKRRAAAVVVTDEEAAPAGLFAGRRKAAFAGIGAIAVAGLFGGLSLANSAGTDNSETDRALPRPAAPKDAVSVPSAAEAVIAAGAAEKPSPAEVAAPKHAKSYTGDSELSRSAGPRHAKPTVSTGRHAKPKTVEKAAPAKPAQKAAAAEDGKQTLSLGLFDVEVTPEGGVLPGLPGIDLVQPAGD